MASAHDKSTGTSDVALWTHYQQSDPLKFAPGHVRQDYLFKHIRRHVSSGKLLEIGYGDAYLLQRLAPLYDCHAADVSPDNVAQMSARFPNIHFSILGCDGLLPFADESFDGVIASEVLEHMDDQALGTAVDETWRVLRSGGHAFITFPARERLEENECFCPNCGTNFHKWGHKQSWDEDKIRRLFGRFNIEGIGERFFLASNLNLFGKLEGYARIGFSKLRRVSGGTFVIILRK